MGTSREPDADGAALWVSESPRFGVVRHVVVADSYAARFDDLNSDFREVCLTVYRRQESSWEELLSSDDVGYPDRDNAAACGWTNGYAWAVGRDEPGVKVRVALPEADGRVRADAEGWWLFVRLAAPPRDTHQWPGAYMRFSKG